MANEIFDPEITYTEDGGAEVLLEAPEENPTPVGHQENLADHLDESELASIGQQLLTAITEDKQTTSDWEFQFQRGLQELGLKIDDEAGPFEGSCAVVHPLLLETIVKFQSRAYSEMLPPGGPVKTGIIGVKNAQKEAQAQRVKDYLNYVIMEKIPEFEDEHERLLWGTAAYGSGFKKIWPDSGGVMAEYVPVSDFIVSYNAKHLAKCDRYTHLIYRLDHELKRDMANGIYKQYDDVTPSQLTKSELGQAEDALTGVTPSKWEGYRLYECHTLFSIPGHEVKAGEITFPVPYIITIDADSGRVFSIRKNYQEDDPTYKKKEYFVHYKLVPGPGFHGFGYIHLIGGLAAGTTTILRSLVDSGMFANLQGGFKARGMRVHGRADEPIAPGEWRDVDATGMDLTKALVPLPYKEPSQTLFQLYGSLVAAGQKFADSTEQVIADSTNYGPVGTTMALLEASTRFQSAIHKRLHRAQKQEIRLIAGVVAETQQAYPYIPGETIGPEILINDFSPEVDILPISDPNIPSQAHRVTKATTIIQLAGNAPGVGYDMREVHMRALAAMGEPDLEKLIPPLPQPQPQDPISDIQAATQGMAIKAFPGQDHESHVMLKSAFLQNPAAGANPMMTTIAPAIAANIREHMVLRFASMVQGMAPQDEKAQAMAAQQLTQMDIQKAQAEAQQGAQDPKVLLAAQELQQRSKEHYDDVIYKAAQLAIRNRDIDVREKQIAADMHVKGAEMADDEKARKHEANMAERDRQADIATKSAKLLADQAKQRDKEENKDPAT